MAGRRSHRHGGKPRALKFRTEMLPRLRGAGGACNIRVPALRENEVINLAFIEQLEVGAEERGSINNQSGPEMHREFIEMSQLEMANLVRRLLEDFVECFTEPIDRAEPSAYYTLCATFDTLLYLVARGNISFGQKSGIEFCKPEGGPPAPIMQREILARLRADRPIHFMVLEITTGLKVDDPDRLASRSAPSPSNQSEPRTIHYSNEGFALDIDKDHLQIRVTDYHSSTLVLSWEELFDFARGLGIEIPKGGRTEESL